MADHGWLVLAIRDIRDYVEMNGLHHLKPVIETAYAAVERGVKVPETRGCLSIASHTEADAVLASLLEEAAQEGENTPPRQARAKLVPS
jgi:hypothetical protein